MPKLHYDSLRYYEMINWQVIEQTEPPITRAIPERQIKVFIENGDKLDGLIPLFPCHTQAVERLVCQWNREEGWIYPLSRLGFRTKIPRFESKKGK